MLSQSLRRMRRQVFTIKYITLSLDENQIYLVSLANQKGPGKSSEPIKTRGNFEKQAQSAGKPVRGSLDFTVSEWLRSCARFLNQTQRVVKQNQRKRKFSLDTQ